jgi:hypothetical protein
MRRALVVALALAGGCTTPRTECVIVISTAGVRIPDDVTALHLTVSDHSPSGDDPLYDAPVPLCSGGLASGCYDLPVTAALYPGPQHGTDSVKVEVDAVNTAGTKVIADAALFTFARQQSLRLDFVLYARCLGVTDCAERDLACGPDANCVPLTPSTVNGEPDLARQAPEDFATPIYDLAGADLLPGADMARPPADLTIVSDLAGCANVVCPPGETCNAGTCNPCGTVTMQCCVTTQPACGVGLACNGAQCEVCGQPYQLCCPVPENVQACQDGSGCDSTGHCPPFMGPDLLQPGDMMTIGPPTDGFGMMSQD